MADIVELECITRLDLPVERILRKATETELDGVVVIGWRSNGEPYFASSYAAGPEILWLLELTKKRLFECTGAPPGSSDAA